MKMCSGSWPRHHRRFRVISCAGRSLVGTSPTRRIFPMPARRTIAIGAAAAVILGVGGVAAVSALDDPDDRTADDGTGDDGADDTDDRPDDDGTGDDGADDTDDRTDDDGTGDGGTDDAD